MSAPDAIVGRGEWIGASGPRPPSFVSKIAATLRQLGSQGAADGVGRALHARQWELAELERRLAAVPPPTRAEDQDVAGVL